MSHLIPEPPNSGGKIRVASLWSAMKRFPAELVVIDVNREGRRSPEGTSLATRGPASKWNKLTRHLFSSLRRRSIITSGLVHDETVEHLRRAVAEARATVLVLGDLALAELIPRLSDLGAAIVVDTHNVESQLSRRLQSNETDLVQRAKHGFRARNNAMLEATYLPLADQVWAVSGSDADWYRGELGLKDVHVVPNAVDPGSFPRLERDPRRILYVGTYDYFPNREAALALMDVSAELEARGVGHDAEVVGRFVTPEMRERAKGRRHVRVVGEVESVKAHYAQAGIFAAPMATGAGTKLKVIEAMAAGCAVVGTPVALEGLPLPDDAVVRAGPGTRDFADALAPLVGDAARQARLGAKAKAWIEGNLSQAHVDDLVAEALRRAHAHARYAKLR